MQDYVRRILDVVAAGIVPGVVHLAQKGVVKATQQLGGDDRDSLPLLSAVHGSAQAAAAELGASPDGLQEAAELLLLQRRALFRQRRETGHLRADLHGVFEVRCSAS